MTGDEMKCDYAIKYTDSVRAGLYNCSYSGTCSSRKNYSRFFYCKAQTIHEVENRSLKRGQKALEELLGEGDVF